MRKLFCAACLLSVCLLTQSSCGRKGCGGWYGDRNLSYQSVEKGPGCAAICEEATKACR